MIDLHCHVLHDMDDGPALLEEAVELCRIACSNNISKLVVTPHILDFQEVETFLRRRDHRITQLRQALEIQGTAVTIFSGAEVFAGDGIFYTDSLNRLTINQSRYLLIEFPSSGLKVHTLIRYIREIQRHGLIPIVAHPERYLYFQRDYRLVEDLLQYGIHYQVNADSLCTGAKRAEYKLASKMLSRKAISFLATDAHSITFRPNNLLDMLCCIPNVIAFDYIDKLVNQNPEAVLHNVNLEQAL